MAKKRSIGIIAVNPGRPTAYRETRFVLDTTRRSYIFNVVPMGAPRMTEVEKWKEEKFKNQPHIQEQRELVRRYFAYRNALLTQAKKMGYVLRGQLEIVFCMPMPADWSDKKQAEMVGMPMKNRPDVDNMVKAFMDALLPEDNLVWRVLAEKRYAYHPSIIVYA